MTSLPPRLYADLIGKPFLDHGRGPDAYDCWGVLQAVLQRMGHSPTDFPSDPTLLQQALSDEWQPLDREGPQPGDGILLRSVMAKYEWHVGMYVGHGTMLHAREDANVCTERFDSPAFRRRIAGFYRYRGRPA